MYPSVRQTRLRPPAIWINDLGDNMIEILRWAPPGLGAEAVLRHMYVTLYGEPGGMLAQCPIGCLHEKFSKTIADKCCVTASGRNMIDGLCSHQRALYLLEVTAEL